MRRTVASPTPAPAVHQRRRRLRGKKVSLLAQMRKQMIVFTGSFSYKVDARVYRANRPHSVSLPSGFAAGRCAYTRAPRIKLRKLNLARLCFAFHRPLCARPPGIQARNKEAVASFVS